MLVLVEQDIMLKYRILVKVLFTPGVMEVAAQEEPVTQVYQEVLWDMVVVVATGLLCTPV